MTHLLYLHSFFFQCSLLSTDPAISIIYLSIIYSPFIYSSFIYSSIIYSSIIFILKQTIIFIIPTYKSYYFYYTKSPHNFASENLNNHQNEKSINH
jgi:hypothetical protein